MPRVLPTLPDVQWSANEGTIGVVGVAAWATVDFLTQIYSQVSAAKDWHFPRILIDANSKIPSRGRYFDLGEPDPSPFIADTIDELIDAGATVVAVPCNTAHILYDRWAARAPESIVSIVDATLSEMPQVAGGTVEILGSTHLARHRTYIDPVMKCGWDSRATTDEEQALVGRIISEIKVFNSLSDETAIDLSNLLQRLESDGTRVLVLACTELSQAMRCVPDHEFAGMIIDSNAALAKACLSRTFSKPSI